MGSACALRRCSSRAHFAALQPRWTGSSHRLATAYLHGRPGTAGIPEFDRAYEALRAAPDRFARIQVTHARDARPRASRRVSTPSVAHTIPIGIDIEHFPLVTPERRATARAIARSHRGCAFVVGSFQKDGVGWAERPGAEADQGAGRARRGATTRSCRGSRAPRPPHGTAPEASFAASSSGLRSRTATCWRRAATSLARAYRAIDVCVVPARQEGGPKAVLEAMASGIPLVTTQVGQAARAGGARHAMAGSSTSTTRSRSRGWTVAIAQRGRASADRRSRSRDRRAERTRAARSGVQLRLAGFVERRST